MQRILIGLLALLALAGCERLGGPRPAQAEGIKARPYTPQYPAAVANPLPSGHLYLGVTGSYANLQDDFFSEDGRLHGGLNLGYIGKVGNWGMGAELEALRYIGDLGLENELDNWQLFAKMRVGYFLSPTILTYATAGYGQAFGEMTGLYGVGLETWTTERISLRLEVDKYTEFDDVIETKFSINFKL